MKLAAQIWIITMINDRWADLSWFLLEHHALNHWREKQVIHLWSSSLRFQVLNKVNMQLYLCEGSMSGFHLHDPQIFIETTIKTMLMLSSETFSSGLIHLFPVLMFSIWPRKRRRGSLILCSVAHRGPTYPGYYRVCRLRRAVFDDCVASSDPLACV